MPYHECLQKLATKFGKIQYQYVPRLQNQIADALETMASMMDGPKKDEARPIVVEQNKEMKKLMGKVNDIKTSYSTSGMGHTRRLQTRMTN